MDELERRDIPMLGVFAALHWYVMTEDNDNRTSFPTQRVLTNEKMNFLLIFFLESHLSK